MGLFQQFPYSNFHDLNLDWLINEIKKMGAQAVTSVNGQTGDVILYKSENIVFPEVEADTWRMVRVADGHTAGVMFQNGLMYVMLDNTADRVYTVDHPPAYPVTSVDGQTGAVQVFPNAATRLPDVTDDYTNIRRQIRTAGTDHIVGIELKADKVYRMDGTTRAQIYDAMNPPPYPVTSVNGQTGDVTITSDVTSVNGQTGAVVLAIPFSNVNIPDVMFSQAVNTHEWGIGRETLDGVGSIQIRTDSTKAEAWIDFFTEDDPQVTYSRKLLTVDDIPSSTGVVSINGLAGVVTIYGDTMPISANDQRSIKDYADELAADMAVVELTNTATHNITSGSYVIWNNALYTASTAISIGDTLSASNLTAVTNGGLNQLHQLIDSYVKTYTLFVPDTNLSPVLYFPSNERAFIFLAGTGVRHGMIYASSTSQGVINHDDIVLTQQFSITTGTNSLTLTRDGGSLTIAVFELQRAGGGIYVSN